MPWHTIRTNSPWTTTILDFASVQRKWPATWFPWKGWMFKIRCVYGSCLTCSALPPSVNSAINQWPLVVVGLLHLASWLRLFLALLLHRPLSTLRLRATLGLSHQLPVATVVDTISTVSSITISTIIQLHPVVREDNKTELQVPVAFLINRLITTEWIWAIRLVIQLLPTVFIITRPCRIIIIKQEQRWRRCNLSNLDIPTIRPRLPILMSIIIRSPHWLLRMAATPLPATKSDLIDHGVPNWFISASFSSIFCVCLCVNIKC